MIACVTDGGLLAAAFLLAVMLYAFFGGSRR